MYHRTPNTHIKQLRITVKNDVFSASGLIGSFYQVVLPLLLVFFPFVTGIQAQLPFANPEIFTSDINLPKVGINSIVEDNDGFLWVSGVNGLHRFDGTEFHAFKHNPEDSTSIVHNTTQKTFFDKETNKLWIPTWGGGLSVMDVRTGKCKNYYHDPDGISTLPNNYLRFVMQDQDKNIWVAVADHGIMRYYPETDRFEAYKYTLSPANPTNVPENRINGFNCHAEDLQNDSILWFGTASGLLSI